MLADIVTVRRAMIAARYNAAMSAATAAALVEQQWALLPVPATRVS